MGETPQQQQQQQNERLHIWDTKLNVSTEGAAANFMVPPSFDSKVLHGAAFDFLYFVELSEQTLLYKELNETNSFHISP